jgi:hypothetical protein
MNLKRKRETREKFALGGLVVKAGLADADRAFLLGALLEIAAIEAGSAAHHRLKTSGAEAFGIDGGPPGQMIDELNG